MNVSLFIKKYMEPFLSDNGFYLKKKEKELFVFENVENPNLKISFTIRHGGGAISPELRRSKEDMLPSYPLSLFMDDLTDLDPSRRNNFWYYDTEAEFLGALEEQAYLLKKVGFNWLHNLIQINIDDILKETAEIRKKKYESWSTDDILKTMLPILNEWINRRVKPNEWK